MTRLFIAHASSAATPGAPRCSDIARYARESSMLGHRQLRRLLLGARILRARGLSGHTSPHSSVLGHRQRRRRLSNIASYAGDSSVLGHRQRRRGLLGAPLVVGLAMSHRCAIKLLYAIQIRVLILGSMSGVLIRACRTTSAKLSDFFFFDPATRFILHLPVGSGTKWAHFTLL